MHERLAHFKHAVRRYLMWGRFDCIGRTSVLVSCLCIPYRVQKNCLIRVALATCQVYCTRTCKAREDELRGAESGALGKLAGISAARDVDLDLLRMILRLLITRAAALGLRPDETMEGDAREVANPEREGGGDVGQVRAGHVSRWQRVLPKLASG